MADIAISEADFSVNGNVNGLPKDVIGNFETRYRSEIPANFLELYQSLVKSINEYQKAFLDENFNRMSRVVITINQAIVKYFTSNADVMFKSYLDKIGENTTKEIKSLLADKNKNYNDKKEEILDVIEKYKAKLIEKVKSKVISSSLSSKENTTATILDANGRPIQQASNEKDTSSESVSNVSKQTISQANVILKDQEKEYNSNIQEFALSIGKTMMADFKRILDSTNKANLSEVKKRFNNINANFANYFYKLNSSANTSINEVQQASQTAMNMHVSLVRKAVNATFNTVTFTAYSIIDARLGVRYIRKVISFWVFSPIFRAIKGVVKFGVNLATNVVKIAWKTLKLGINAIRYTVKFAASVASGIMSPIFGLSKKIHSKIAKTGIFGILGSMLKTFFMTYPGAYFLGFILGRMWRMVLKYAGVSDERIVEETYDLTDDVAMPVFNKLKEKFTSNKYVEKILEEVNGNDKNGVKPLRERVVEWWNKNPVVKTIKNVVEFFRTFRLEEIKEVISNTISFIGNYVWPAVRMVGGLLYALFPNVKDFGTLLRINRGASAGLTRAFSRISSFSKKLAIKGGIRPLLLSSIMIGSAAILGMNEKVGSKDNDDRDQILKMGISAKYASLFGYNGSKDISAYEDKNSESFRKAFGIFDAVHRMNEKFKKISTVLAKKETILGNLELLTHVGDEKTRKENKKRYEIARDTFETLTRNKEETFSQLHSVEDLLKEYEKDVEGKGLNDKYWKATDYGITYDILSYNGQYIYPPELIDELRTPLEKLKMLQLITGAKLEMISNGFQKFAADITSEAVKRGDLSAFDDENEVQSRYNISKKFRINLGKTISESKFNEDTGTTDLEIRLDESNESDNREYSQYYDSYSGKKTFQDIASAVVTVPNVSYTEYTRDPRGYVLPTQKTILSKDFNAELAKANAFITEYEKREKTYGLDQIFTEENYKTAKAKRKAILTAIEESKNSVDTQQATATAIDKIANISKNFQDAYLNNISSISISNYIGETLNAERVSVLKEKIWSSETIDQIFANYENAFDKENPLLYIGHSVFEEALANTMESMENKFKGDEEKLEELSKAKNEEYHSFDILSEIVSKNEEEQSDLKNKIIALIDEYKNKKSNKRQ